MIDFILLCVVAIFYLIGFVFLGLDIKNLNSEKNKTTEDSKLPVYLKRSFSWILGGFFLMILVNLF